MESIMDGVANSKASTVPLTSKDPEPRTLHTSNICTNTKYIYTYVCIYMYIWPMAHTHIHIYIYMSMCIRGVQGAALPDEGTQDQF